MKRIKNRFEGLYWRYMFVTVGMVLLTLALLGASFFALSYNYARNQKTDEIGSRAAVMSQLSVGYLENGRFLELEELQADPDFQRLATFAAAVSDVNFLICDEEGHVLLSTDSRFEGEVLTIPQDMTREVMEEGGASQHGDLNGLYEKKHLIVGVPAVNGAGEIVGEVFAVSTTRSLDDMWHGLSACSS